MGIGSHQSAAAISTTWLTPQPIIDALVVTERYFRSGIMDEVMRLRMRRAHTKHKGYCTCGKIVSGNGGLFNHREMHKRKSDGHYFMTYSAWLDQQKGQNNGRD